MIYFQKDRKKYAAAWCSDERFREYPLMSGMFIGEEDLPQSIASKRSAWGALAVSLDGEEIVLIGFRKSQTVSTRWSIGTITPHLRHFKSWASPSHRMFITSLDGSRVRGLHNFEVDLASEKNLDFAFGRDVGHPHAQDDNESRFDMIEKSTKRVCERAKPQGTLHVRSFSSQELINELLRRSLQHPKAKGFFDEYQNLFAAKQLGDGSFAHFHQLVKDSEGTQYRIVDMSGDTVYASPSEYIGSPKAFHRLDLRGVH